jgi:hypothetical protein
MINWFGVATLNVLGFVDVIISTNKYSRREAYYRNRMSINRYKKDNCNLKDFIYYHNKYQYFYKQYGIYDNIADNYWKINYYQREKMVDPWSDMLLFSMKPEGCRILIEDGEPVELIRDECFVK